MVRINIDHQGLDSPSAQEDIVFLGVMLNSPPDEDPLHIFAMLSEGHLRLAGAPPRGEGHQLALASGKGGCACPFCKWFKDHLLID